AMDGLMLALKDKSNTIRSTAANALQNLGGEAGRAARAELNREQLLEAQRSEPDTRSYSREELIATIQDPDREYPLPLKYLVPILPVPASVEQAPFLATVHAGEDGLERLTFWKRTGVDRYQKVKVVDCDPGNQEHFDVPITFHAMVQVKTAGGPQVEERGFFVNVPIKWNWGRNDQIFAVDSDGLHSVEIESPQVPNPEKKYPAVSRVPDPGSYHQLEWSFPIRDGGEVTGTYKVVKDETENPPTWKMVVATAEWERPSQEVEASKKLADVPQLIGELKGSDLQRRRDAAYKLSNIEPMPPEAIQALAEAAKTMDPKEPLPAGTQAPAQSTVTAAGTTHTTSAPVTRSESPQTCEIAIRSLGSAAQRDSMVWPILIDALKGCSSPKPAAEELAKFGGSVLPLLLKALKDKDPRARAGAAEAMGLMVKPPVVERYFDPDRPFGTAVRLTSASAAAALAPAIPGLAEALQDPDSSVRNQAAITLALASPNDKQAVPILVQLVGGADHPLREAALAALDGMGESAKDAVPAVERVLETEKDRREVGEAAHVLGSIAGAAACEPLAHAIADGKDSFVRQCAVAAMGQLWPACPETIPTLMGTFGGDDQVAFSSVRVLRKIGGPAMPALTMALKSSD
ncbi:MAG TPA: HEAT repeat domain-containing protein, partial [Candidatus Binataceae bacterium]|nr:HEAT repeat domain-containing protein [Candidatus Binataceae bacterium]